MEIPHRNGSTIIETIAGVAECRLRNGLHLLIAPEPSRPTVTTCLTVHVGSRHEGRGEFGLAHLLEHLLFKRTRCHENVSEALHARGARFNGTTWFDRTNYFETLPAEEDNLAFALQVEAERLAHARFTAEELEAEKTVVLNELERGENRPTRVLYQRMMAAAFDWHPYRRPTIGSREDVAHFTPDGVRAFYERWYRPDNATLVVAGAVEPEEVRKLAEAIFGEIILPGTSATLPPPSHPHADGERSVVLRRVGDVGAAGAAYRIPPAGHADFVPLQVLDEVFTAAPFGRAYKRLVETGRASSVSAAVLPLHDPSVFYVLAEPNAAGDPDPESLRDEVIAVVEGVAEEPVTDEERELAVNRLLKRLDLEQDDVERWAVQLGHWAAIDDWTSYALREQRLGSASTDDLNRVAATYLARANRTAGAFVPTPSPQRVVIPKDRPTPAEPDELRRIASLAAGESLGGDPLGIESRVRRQTLDVGARLALLPKRARGAAVHVRLTVRFGNLESLTDRAETSRLLPWLMLRGPRGRSRLDYQRALDRLRARFTASGGPGWAAFAIRCRGPMLAEALDLLRAVVRDPALDPAEFETLRASHLASLAKQRSEPSAVAQREVSRWINPYPDGDPRSVPTLAEAIERLASASLDDLAALHAEQWQGAHAVLSAAGEFDPESAAAAAAGMLDGWEAPTPFRRLDRNVVASFPGRRAVFAIPEKDSLAYVSSMLFPLRDDDPDFARLSLANHVLGASSLSSRLGRRVRREEGLSYSISSAFSASSLDERAVFGVQASCAAAELGRFEEVLNAELGRFVAEGVLPDELETSRRSLLQRRRTGRTDDSALVRMLETSVIADRDLSFSAELDAALESAEVDEVGSAVARRLDPRQLATAVAGDVVDV